MLGGLATVGAASAAAGAGTMAYFTDTDSSTDNSVQAGTLDLTFGQSQTVPFLDETGIKPGDQGLTDLKLQNSGSIEGLLEIDISNIQSTDKNGGTPGVLEDYLEIEMRIDGTPAIQREVVSNLSPTPVVVVDSQDNTTVQAGNEKTFTLEWWLPSSTKNKAKGDSVTLEFTFTLTQTGAQ